MKYIHFNSGGILMLKNEKKQLNFYAKIYDNIPENHLLKQIDAAVSFDFINEMLKDSYCLNFGRPAKEPEMMVKILLIQRLYDLSDEKVMEDLAVNLAYMWFIGINPDEKLPHASLLAKFRTMRLKENTLDEIITEVVRQCVEKGIIKSNNGISIDSTHIEANTVKKVPERIMKHLAIKIFKKLEKDDVKIPDYTQIENHHEAKQVMKAILEDAIEQAGEKAKEEAEEAKAILESDLFIEQKGIRSLVDPDARVGYKSKTNSFFGFKMEYAMTNEGIITGVGVHNGSYVDSLGFEWLYAVSKEVIEKVEAIFADKAYFKKRILDLIIGDKALPYIPVNESTYKIDEKQYSYNKDSDQWFCSYGNGTISKKLIQHRTKKQQVKKRYKYTFDKEICRNCPNKSNCIKRGNIKKINVGIDTNEYYEHSQWAKTQEFSEGYKQRARIEGKNAEMKRFHGLARAKGYGLKSVTCQAKLTALATNLKRIARLASSLNSNFSNILDKISEFFKSCKNIPKLKSWNKLFNLKTAHFSVVPNRPPESPPYLHATFIAIFSHSQRF